MFISVLDLFKVGIGPSSSHTMGPMVAANAFLSEVRHFIDSNPDTDGYHVRCTLKDSLAYTGVGHATDKAVTLGLHGYLPNTIINENMDEVLAVSKNDVPGIKIFMGSSTGNMLVDDVEVLEKIFSSTKMIISVHCEDEATIRKNTALYTEKFGENIPIKYHPIIRSEESCYISSSKAIELAKKTGARLHVFHVSTAKETTLFRNDIPLEEKQITSEVCVHHLWFSDQDYKEKGTHIKWNPAVKTAADRQGLWKALLDDRLDIIATDHAPHTLEEKSNSYLKAPSGGPLVQHALLALLEKVSEKVISIEKVVEKACHNPAIIFQIENRGFIKEGYYADLVLIDPKAPQTVCKENILYKCGWSPFEGTTFSSSVTHTFVNGVLMYHEGVFNNEVKGKRITFNR